MTDAKTDFEFSLNSSPELVDKIKAALRASAETAEIIDIGPGPAEVKILVATAESNAPLDVPRCIDAATITLANRFWDAFCDARRSLGPDENLDAFLERVMNALELNLADIASHYWSGADDRDAYLDHFIAAVGNDLRGMVPAQAAKGTTPDGKKIFASAIEAKDTRLPYESRLAKRIIETAAGSYDEEPSPECKIGSEGPEWFKVRWSAMQQATAYFAAGYTTAAGSDAAIDEFASQVKKWVAALGPHTDAARAKAK